MAYLLTDSCTIKPVTQTASGSGTYTDVEGTARTYNGSSSIPCRLDIFKRFSTSDVFSQETVVSDYFLFVPMDMVVEVGDHIYHNGILYQIRALFDDGSWSDSKRISVVVVR